MCYFVIALVNLTKQLSLSCLGFKLFIFKLSTEKLELMGQRCLFLSLSGDHRQYLFEVYLLFA